MGELVKPLILTGRTAPGKYKCAFRRWGCPGTIEQLTKYADNSPIPNADEGQYLCRTCGVIFIGHSFKRVSNCQPNLSQVASWLNTHRALHEKWENRSLWRRLTSLILKRKKPSA